MFSSSRQFSEVFGSDLDTCNLSVETKGCQQKTSDTYLNRLVENLLLSVLYQYQSVWGSDPGRNLPDALPLARVDLMGSLLGSAAQKDLGQWLAFAVCLKIYVFKVSGKEADEHSGQHLIFSIVFSPLTYFYLVLH